MKISFVTSRTLAILFILCTCANLLLAQKPNPNFGISIATPPAILSTSPTKNKLNVANNSNVTATFNTNMNTSTLISSNVTVFGSQSGKHAASITLNGTTGFTLDPTADFKKGEVVSVNLTGGIQSSGSIPLPNGYHWNFNSKVLSGTGVFTQTSTVALGGTAQPVASTSGDFDGDGDIDIASVNQISNDVAILLNDGHGAFTSSTVSAGTGRTGIVAGDWDNDGDIDLAVIGGGASGTAGILTNDGSGNFTLTSSPSTGFGPQAVATADVDGDGDLDLVVALNSVNQVAIMTNNGSGTFTSVATPTVGTAPQSLTTADFNGDGAMDIAIVNFIGSTGTLLTNDGTGTSWTSTSFTTGTQPNSIVSGDFDNDGDADLAVANQTSNTLTILKNNGSGSFSVFASPAVTNQPYSLSAVDVDADGDLDLAVVQFGADSVSTFKNNGTATFSSFSKVAVQGQPSSVSLGDFDGDGDADLAVTNRSGHTVSILKNNVVPPSVTTTNPTANQINVLQSVNIVVRFSQSMNPSSLTTNNVFVFGSLSGKHTGAITVANSDSTLIFNPDSDFNNDELVSVNLTQNIVSAASETLAHGFHWNFTTSTSGGTALFSETSSPAVGTNPFDMVTADFDNDGDADIATANNSSNTVSILTNNGTGTFTLSSSPTVGTNPQAIVAGDFDNDGDIDVAVANVTSTTLSILKNDGTGAFTLSSSPNTSVAPLELAVGDVDGDGDLDLAVVINGNPVKILLNDGTGDFTSGANIPTGSIPVAISLADVDGDGDLDMIVVNSGSDNISIMKNSGSGTFPTSATVAVGVFPTALAVGDIDTDGDVDIVVVNRTDGTISVLKNNGTGTFTLSSSPAVGASPLSVTIGNFDNDADLDVAVANQSDNSASILRNNGSGTFTATTVSGISTNPSAISSADFDGDGDVDLAVAKSASAAVSILKNNVTPNFALSASSINFGDVVLGSNKKDSVEVVNSGSASLSITSVSSSNTSFSVTPNDGTISGGDSMKFYITFTPGSVSSASGRIVFTHNATGSPDTVLVSGNGIQSPAPVFSASPSSKSFGYVQIGSPKEDSIIVTNNNGAPVVDDLVITSVTSDNAKVTVTPGNATIIGGAGRQFVITMTPDVEETLRANIIFTHNAAGSPDTVTVNGIGVTSIPHFYRSFHPDSIALSKDQMKKVGKPVAVKATRAQFTFSVVADSDNVNDLHLEFGTGIDTTESFTVDSALTVTPVVKSTLKKWDITFTSSLNSGNSITVSGYSVKGAVQKVSSYWWTRNGVLVGKKKKNPTFTQNILRLPMPNKINVMQQAFTQGAFTATGGLVVGIAQANKDSAKKYGWVVLKKYTDVLSSLSKTSKNVVNLHDSASHGFDRLSNGKPFLGKKTSLPPTVQDNELFANLVALKVSIAASALAKTPIGFGELIFDDTIANPLNGLMLKQIATKADTLMTGGTGRTFESAGTFANLSETIERILNAFEGTMDTTTFSGKLVTPGTIDVGTVYFMHRDSSIIPAQIIPLEAENISVPEQYSLAQNYPNPFNPTTTLSFNIGRSSLVSLNVYNLLGQKVATLLNKEAMDEGAQEVTFNASNLPSGVYFYRINIESVDEDGTQHTFTDVKKMLLMK